MRILSFLLIIVVFIADIKSQNLPSQWHTLADGRTLVAGDQLSDGLYDESVVEEIRLYFPQSNYWNLLTSYYNSKTDIPATLKYKGESFDSVGVRFKGQTSYFMNNTQKKSFNISMFMITAPLLTHSVKINLPVASSETSNEKPETVTLAIDDAGRLFWNNDPMDNDALLAKLAEASSRSPQPELHLRADRETRYQTIAEVMSKARASGIEKLGFVTQPE